VLVVSKSDYDNCNTGSAMNTIQTGPATVTLSSASASRPGHLLDPLINVRRLTYVES
jgi:hypothetical protein